MQDTQTPTRRQEAQPFSWQELTGAQRTAIEEVASLMLDAVRAVDSDAKPTPAGTDPRRYSQLAFVDGVRGMGKSSVLLTLREITDPDYKHALPEEAKTAKELRDQRDRFVWLETLDMEPIGRRTNLFAAILVRIAAQCDAVGKRAYRPAAGLDETGSYEQTLADLHELQRDAVLAWEGTVLERGGHIDPHAWAVEVLRSEQAGLQLNSRLRKVLDGLGKLHSPSPDAPAPIFVLPVDDFDLAPTRCLELLRLIRLVTTPRLFFLVAGNTRIAEDVLRLQTEGELSGVAGGQPTTEMWQRRLNPAAREIAANNVRKLIPPAQRAHLPAVGPEEALKFHVHSDGPTLGEVLAEIRFERNTAVTGSEPVSLRDFLLLDDPLLTGGYSGTRWLGGTPRQVLDRGLALARRSGTQDDYGEALLDLISGLLRWESNEEWRLDARQRERMAEVFEGDGILRFDFQSAFVFDEEDDFFIDELAFEHGAVKFRRPRSFRLLLGRTAEESPELSPASLEGEVVPKLLAAGVFFLHDLAVTLWGGYLRHGPLLHGRRAQVEIAPVYWSTPGRPDLSLRWHIPDWWTVREYERFSYHWASHARHSDSLEDYALAWLAAQLEVLLDEAHDETREGRGWGRLTAMLKRLADEAPTRRAREMLRWSALTGIALFLAPESAVPGEIADRLLARVPAFGKALQDPDLAARIRSWRAMTANMARQRELADSPTVALYAAVSPQHAAQELRHQLVRVVEQTVALVREDVPIPERLMPLLSAVEKEDPDDKLCEAAQAALGVEKEPFDQLQTLLPRAIVALAGRYAHHPINALGDGVLVPTSVDLQEWRQATPASRLRP